MLLRLKDDLQELIDYTCWKKLVGFRQQFSSSTVFYRISFDFERRQSFRYRTDMMIHAMSNMWH